MGEVYRARDTRLGQDVAVKLLPEHVAHDPEALARFDREARAVAALSYPHIAALFDIGETDGTHYLVMELLEGETLAARLRRGALPKKAALRIGAEVAEALGAAHAHAVVHRDVKPANIMLTRSGVKLLDFGVARLQRGGGATGGTAATTGLDDGRIAGTLPYMAPEQLEGRAADARADVWALGCVLYEMLTGEPAFAADSPAGLVAAIEKEAVPSVLSRRAGTSPGLDRAVGRCLQKDPDERWQSARDLALRLREISDLESETRPQAEQDRSGLLWLFDVERRTYRPLSDRGIASSPVWSPDGTRLAFGWSEAGPSHLWYWSHHCTRTPGSGRRGSRRVPSRCTPFR